MTHQTAKTLFDLLTLEINQATEILAHYESQMGTATPLKRNELEIRIMEKRLHAQPLMDAFYELVSEKLIPPNEGEEFYMGDLYGKQLEESQRLIEGFAGQVYPFHAMERSRPDSPIFIRQISGYCRI